MNCEDTVLFFVGGASLLLDFAVIDFTLAVQFCVDVIVPLSGLFYFALNLKCPCRVLL